MDGVNGINDLNALMNELSKGIKLMGKCGREWANAERQYRIAEGKAVLLLKDQGHPATLIDKLAKAQIADTKFERDQAEVLWKTSQENVNVLKLQIRVLENQIAREWGHE